MSRSFVELYHRFQNFNKITDKKHSDDLYERYFRVAESAFSDLDKYGCRIKTVPAEIEFELEEEFEKLRISHPNNKQSLTAATDALLPLDFELLVRKFAQYWWWQYAHFDVDLYALYSISDYDWYRLELPQFRRDQCIFILDVSNAWPEMLIHHIELKKGKPKHILTCVVNILTLQIGKRISLLN